MERWPRARMQPLAGFSRSPLRLFPIPASRCIITPLARMAELADALDLGSGKVEKRGWSGNRTSPCFMRIEGELRLNWNFTRFHWI